MRQARYHDPDFDCEGSNCWYSGNPERTADLNTFVDANGHEFTYCDMCEHHRDYVHRVHKCSWCRRYFCWHKYGTYDRYISEYARANKLSFHDAYMRWYTGVVEEVGPAGVVKEVAGPVNVVKGVGRACWGCLSGMGPVGTESLLCDLDGPRLRKRFHKVVPNELPANPTPDDRLAHQEAYLCFLATVCEEVHADDVAAKKNRAEATLAMVKRTFPLMAEDEQRAIERAGKRARINVGGMSQAEVAHAFATFLNDCTCSVADARND